MADRYYKGAAEVQDALAVTAKWISGNRKVDVQYHNGSAVDADVERGVIRIPKMVCASGVTEEALMLVRGRVYHEAGHVDESKAVKKADYPQGALFTIWNGLEDRRMEAIEAGKHPGARVVFRWNNDYYNREIAGKISSGGINAPLWEAICSMSFMVEGLSPMWVSKGKAAEYIKAAYAEFMKVRQCSDARDTLELARKIYNLLKDVNKDINKEKQGQGKGKGKDDKNQKSEGGEKEDSESQSGPAGDMEDEKGEDSEGDKEEGGECKGKDGEEDKEDSDGESKGGDKGDGEDDDGEGEKDGEEDKEDSEVGKDDSESDKEDDGDDKDGEGEKDGDDSDGEEDDKDDKDGEGEKDGEEDKEDSKAGKNDSESDKDDGDEGEGDGSKDDGEGKDKADGDEDGDENEFDGDGDGNIKPGDGKYKLEEEDGGGKGDGKTLEEEVNGVSQEEIINEKLDGLFKDMNPADLAYISRRDLDQHSYPETSESDKVEFKRERDEISVMIASMTQALEQALRSITRCRRKPYLRQGRIDRKRLVSIAKSLSKEVFYRKQNGIDLDVAVAITIDESGSMSSSYMYVRIMAIAIGEALQAIGVPFEIIGSTTQYDKGDFGMPPMDGFSRTNPIIYKHYKDFHEVWSGVRHRMVKTGPHKHNIDGEVVEYAAFSLGQRKEQRKIVFSLTDGEPCSGHKNNTVMAQNLMRVCERTRKQGIEVYGFGIGTKGPEHLYGEKNFIYMERGNMGSEFVKNFASIVTQGRVHV